MRIAYIEPFSGASGDMLLGALIDAGLALDSLVAELNALNLPELRIDVAPASQHGISGSHAEVKPESGHHARSWRDIRTMISTSDLPEQDKHRSIEIFTALAEAEATVHGVSVDEVHFHEVGALDTIVDIVGFVVGTRLLGIEQIFSAPVHVGGGTVRSAHGILPVPAPATARLLAANNVPIARSHEGEDAAGEMLTPTGAAILATTATFERPPFSMSAVGHGFGTKEMPWANMVRISIGEMVESSRSLPSESLLILETNIDDMSPQFYEILSERLFAADALDVWSTPIQMKKNRPAQCISALARPADRDRLVNVLMEQSTTLGVRVSTVDRIAADRRMETVGTRWGDIRVKLKIWNGRVLDIAPEYDDCAAVARLHDIGIRSVWNEAYRIGEVFVGRRVGAESRLTLVDPLGQNG